MEVYLCEKPSQAEDLAKVLGVHGKGSGFIGDKQRVVVTWAYGHLLEQYMPDDYDESLKQWSLDSLPIIPTQWKSKVRAKASTQYNVVQSLLKSADHVYLATDYDREGEAIGRSLLDRAQYDGPLNRVCLRALDKKSIRNALSTMLDGRESLPLYY